MDFKIAFKVFCEFVLYPFLIGLIIYFLAVFLVSMPEKVVNFIIICFVSSAMLFTYSILMFVRYNELKKENECYFLNKGEKK